MKCRTASWFGVAATAAMLLACAAACEDTDDGLEECAIEGGIYFGAQASLSLFLPPHSHTSALLLSSHCCCRCCGCV